MKYLFGIVGIVLIIVLVNGYSQAPKVAETIKVSIRMMESSITGGTM